MWFVFCRRFAIFYVPLRTIHSWCCVHTCQFPNAHTNAALEYDTQFKIWFDKKHPEVYADADKDFYNSLMPYKSTGDDI